MRSERTDWPALIMGSETAKDCACGWCALARYLLRPASDCHTADNRLPIESQSADRTDMHGEW